jgi:hypothetical protein
MNSQELRNLQEAYMDVYDEGYKSFPYGKVEAKSKKLKTDRESLGEKPLTGKSDSEVSDTLNKMEKSRSRETRLGLQSNIAHSFVPKQKEKSNRNRPESEKRSKTVEPQKSFGNRLTRSDNQGIQDSYDLYDVILSHLLDEGYADSYEAAESIMVNMSEDWRESIIEEVLDEGAYDVYLNRMGVKSKLSDMAKEIYKDPKEKREDDRKREKRNKTHSVGRDLLNKYIDTMNKDN